jgi:ABC-type transport system substrate-binding protein
VSARLSSPDHPISRRDLLRIATFGGGSLALLALASRVAPVAAAQPSGGKEFHGAWPFEVPPNGHFNLIFGVTHGILNDGIYKDLVLAPLAMYYWADQKWLPLLAREWGFDQTANTFTVKLNSGLKWSDGNPITSKDVVTTAWAYRLSRNVVWQFIDSVNAVDETTVTFHMNKPSTVVERYILRQLNLLSDVQYGAGPVQQRQNAGYRRGQETQHRLPTVPPGPGHRQWPVHVRLQQHHQRPADAGQKLDRHHGRQGRVRPHRALQRRNARRDAAGPEP